MDKKLDIEFGENGWLVTYQIQDQPIGHIFFPKIQRKIYTDLAKMLADIGNYCQSGIIEGAVFPVKKKK